MKGLDCSPALCFGWTLEGEGEAAPGLAAAPSRPWLEVPVVTLTCNLSFPSTGLGTPLTSSYPAPKMGSWVDSAG